MKSILPDALADTVTLKRRAYKLNTDVWHVMRALDVAHDPELMGPQQDAAAVWYLYRFPRPPRRMHRQAVEAAFALINEPGPYRVPKGGPRALSLTQDAGLICAAFMQLYGIDLIKESTRLDWRLFQAYLSGITDATRLGEIMSIRTQKMPKRTQYNGAQIAELQRLKSIYAITDNAAHGQSFEDGLAKMVQILTDMAQRNG